MSYDVKCSDLAAHFLSDFKVEGEELKIRTDRLAQDIQNAIEDYLQDAELEEKPPIWP